MASLVQMERLCSPFLGVQLPALPGSRGAESSHTAFLPSFRSHQAQPVQRHPLRLQGRGGLVAAQAVSAGGSGGGVFRLSPDLRAGVWGGAPPRQGPPPTMMDPGSMLLRQRIVFLGGQVDDNSADLIISQLLLLDAQDGTKDIKMFINSPGGSVTAGMGIYDTMKLCRADVQTICFGLAASMGAFLLCSGTRGKRFCMPNARVMIHQPLGGIGGAATDVSIQMREMMYHKVKLNKIIGRNTGKTEFQIEEDTDRDYFMDAWEAVSYGLVDGVIGDDNPNIVAPRGEAVTPEKARVSSYWEIKEGAERRVLPSEDTKKGGFF